MAEKLTAAISQYTNLRHSPQCFAGGASEDGVGVGEGVENEIDGGFADFLAAESGAGFLRRRLGVGLGQILQRAQNGRENVHLDRLGDQEKSRKSH